MGFDTHIYVLNTIYVHPHIASCSEGTGIAAMDVKQPGFEAYHSPTRSICHRNLHIDNLPRQPLTN